MGTLFNQPPRQFLDVDESKVEHFLETVLKLSKKYNIPTQEVIYSIEVLELRRKNDLYVRNGDTFDEQMAGFGDLLKDLNKSVESITESVGILAESDV